MSRLLTKPVPSRGQGEEVELPSGRGHPGGHWAVQLGTEDTGPCQEVGGRAKGLSLARFPPPTETCGLQEGPPRVQGERLPWAVLAQEGAHVGTEQGTLGMGLRLAGTQGSFRMLLAGISSICPFVRLFIRPSICKRRSPVCSQ